MSIKEQGFLSPEIAAWIDKHRTENQAWFSLAMDLNSLAQQLLLEVPSMIAQQSLPEVPSEENKAFLAALLFIRGISSFQSAILLAERGMTQDARTITRSCYETLFCFGALHKDPGFLENFEKADLYSKKTFANASRSLKPEPEVAEILSQFLDDLERSGEKAERLRWQEVANLAGMGDVYDVCYRGLSNDAAHPSLIALKRYYGVDEN